LTTLPAVVGQVIHEAAATRARAVRDGLRPPSLEMDQQRAFATLNAIVRPRGRTGAVPMLKEIAGGEWPDGRIPPAVAAATKAKVEALLAAMHDHPVWSDLAGCGRGDILVCDALEAHLLEIDGTPVDVFAAPDLVWTSRETVHVPDYGVPLLAPVLTVLDWKTGLADGRVDAAKEQLSVYAWWVQSHVGAHADTRHVIGRVADLAAAPEARDVQLILGPADVARGRALIEDEARAITRERGPDGRVPREATAQNLRACALCAFPSICR
jgi:hypothetical protein